MPLTRSPGIFNKQYVLYKSKETVVNPVASRFRFAGWKCGCYFTLGVVLIDSTGMLCCGEDLGMIPACVPSVMDELEILSLKVQRMPDDPSREFADTRRYPYYCVATTSTHDMGGFRQWWEEDPKRTRRFYNDGLGLRGDAPYYAEPWICDRVVTDHLTSPAMLCILPLQDWLALDGRIRRNDPRQEQINDPANPDNHWNYRMHLTLRDLLSEKEFNTYLRKKNEASGR